MVFTRISSAVLALMALSTLATAAIDLTPLERDPKQTYTVAMSSKNFYNNDRVGQSSDNGAILNVDILYWLTRLENSDYAYSTQGAYGAYPIKGQAKLSNFDWNWGFRVGAGYSFDHDNWNGNVTYTWLNAKGSGTSHAARNGVLQPKRSRTSISKISPFKEFENCQTARVDHTIKYQNVMVELGRECQVSPTVSLRPHYGARGLFLNQLAKTKYSGGDQLLTAHVQLKDECNVSGFGPHIGVASNWELGNGFSFVNKLGATFVLSRFDVSYTANFSADKNQKIEIDGTHHGFAPSMSFNLGLRYQREIKESNQQFSMMLGLDGEHLWNINRVLRNGNTPDDSVRRDSNLGMYGLTLNVGWAF